MSFLVSVISVTYPFCLPVPIKYPLPNTYSSLSNGGAITISVVRIQAYRGQP